MDTADIIGRRGEFIAVTCLTREYRTDSNVPYFWPHYLGEKNETFDFFVELLGAGVKTPFFLVQVKGTRKAFTRGQSPPRLRVGVTKKDVCRMVAYPAPTYVIGVHEMEERAFIVSVHGSMAKALPSITTAHELTAETLRRLWEEVNAFWEVRDMSRSSSSFLN
jgi:hypothetical protein